MDSHPAVGPRPHGEPDLAVDRHRQDEAVVVIGMIADEVHAAGSPREEGRRGAKPALEFLAHARAQFAAHEASVVREMASSRRRAAAASAVRSRWGSPNISSPPRNFRTRADPGAGGKT